MAGVNADRARELDQMIDRGDWAGVVEAAGRFNQADKDASSHASRGPTSMGSDTADSTTKRSKQLKEEEDALAQAEIWMQIAQQSKSEGATGMWLLLFLSCMLLWLMFLILLFFVLLRCWCK